MRDRFLQVFKVSACQPQHQKQTIKTENENLKDVCFSTTKNENKNTIRIIIIVMSTTTATPPKLRYVPCNGGLHGLGGSPAATPGTSMNSQASTPTEILSRCQPLRRVETRRQVLPKNLAKVCHDGIGILCIEIVLSAIYTVLLFRHFEFESQSKRMEIGEDDDEGNLFWARDV
jgi:hypothetical protein